MTCNVWKKRRLVVTMPSRSLTEIGPLRELCGLVGLCGVSCYQVLVVVRYQKSR